MAPIKFENNLKDSLEKRTLNPSKNSWDTLSQRLDDNHKANNIKKPLWWIGIAASIAILISVGIVIIKIEDEIDNSPEMVVEDIKKSKVEEPLNLESENTQEAHHNLVDEKMHETEVVANAHQGDEIQSTNAQNQTKLPGSKKPKPLSNVPSENKIRVEVAINDLKANNNLLIEETEIMEVVAQIRMLQSERDGDSSKEIDSLLKAAQRELVNDNKRNSSNRMVDAETLLKEVEGDLERTFRNKVFDAIKGGYDTVKTAVAERNQ